jgi:hypothetical protein
MDHLVWLQELTKNDGPTVGGRGANLGELKRLFRSADPHDAEAAQNRRETVRSAPTPCRGPGPRRRSQGET